MTEFESIHQASSGLFFSSTLGLFSQPEAVEDGNCRALLCQLQPQQQQHTDRLLRTLLRAVQGCLVPPEGRGRDAGPGGMGGRGSAGANPVPKRKANACPGTVARQTPSCRRAGRGSRDCRGMAACLPAPVFAGPPGLITPRSLPGPPGPPPSPTTWPPPPRARPWPGLAAQSARRRRAASVPLAAAESSRAGGASPRARPPPHGPGAGRRPPIGAAARGAGAAIGRAARRARRLVGAGAVGAEPGAGLAKGAEGARARSFVSVPGPAARASATLPPLVRGPIPPRRRPAGRARPAPDTARPPPLRRQAPPPSW